MDIEIMRMQNKRVAFPRTAAGRTVLDSVCEPTAYWAGGAVLTMAECERLIVRLTAHALTFRVR